ncbi:HAD-IIIC family phosphatase [Komagataeibacter sp. FNDCR2]|uniref:HAD-IIIC family phosphatase n=1 Tax=Komagataeibacter sp. FNDCR2 TaxID=2878682 RepID=UPI001E3D25AE|nr:HAD-IIIC family phosphatase [Komagataeibacter sp. FNDCR2]MCE2576774.1 HAD-IIIC family phosphatase [Komagataeibacter sp. FNDCR2]
MVLPFPCVSAESLHQETPSHKLLLLGQCSVWPLGDKFPDGWEVHHHLMENTPSSMLPEIDFTAYDGAIVAITLRHILSFSGGETKWAKLIGRPEMDEYFSTCADYIRDQIKNYQKISDKIPCFFLSFIEPRQNYLGILAKNYTLDNPVFFIRELNRVLEAAISEMPQGYYIETNEALNTVGRIATQDDILFHIGHASYIFDDFIVYEDDGKRLQISAPPSAMYPYVETTAMVQSIIADRIVDAFAIISKKDTIKLIIIDLDDTLWRGVAADSNKQPWEYIEGWPMGLIESLLIFKARGGLLAICSKNNEQETKERFENIIGRELNLSDFAAVAINFDSKSNNITSILKSVNVLPENTLFIDDNPREIEEVRRILPAIRTLSRQHYDWRRVILTSPETQVDKISAESRTRTQTVQASIARREEQASMSREEWVHSLNIRQRHIIINSSTHPNFNRAVELINKTNQFNTTGKRWNTSEINNLFESGGVIICAFMVDRLVDNGLIGCVLVSGENILQIVLSCRVFGFAVEVAMLRIATKYILLQHNVVRANIIDTGRNHTCHSYFAQSGFKDCGNGWFETVVAPIHPDWIQSIFSTSGSVKVEKYYIQSKNIVLDCIIHNASNDIWASDRYPINISYHIRDRNSSVILWDGNRVGEIEMLLPDEYKEVKIYIPREDLIIPDGCRVEIDMVHELRKWFSEDNFVTSNLIIKELI